MDEPVPALQIFKVQTLDKVPGILKCLASLDFFSFFFQEVNIILLCHDLFVPHYGTSLPIDAVQITNHCSRESVSASARAAL